MRAADLADPRLALDFLSKAFFVVFGAVIISSAFVFLANGGTVGETMRFWIPTSLALVSGHGWVANWVYPPSVVIIGAFFIAFGLKFGFRGIGLVFLVCGGFDVFDKLAALYLEGLFTGSFHNVNAPSQLAQLDDQYFWIQNATMFGGFFLAGFPKLKMNRWLWVTVAILVASIMVMWPNIGDIAEWDGFRAYQVYLIALFVWVYTAAELRHFSKPAQAVSEMISA